MIPSEEDVIKCLRFEEKHMEVVTSPQENLSMRLPVAASYKLTNLSVLLAIIIEQ